MVMRRSSAWTRNCAREVIRTLGRYLSIMAIIALGVGFFCGLKVTKKAMIKTFDTYADDCNMYDLQLLSTLGFTDDDVEQLVLTDGVLDAEGSFSIDAVAQIDGREQVLKVHSLTERINKLSLVSGRLPSSADECVLDADAFGSDVIGKSVTVTQTDAESDTLNEETYTVVGLVNSVCYISAERGSSSLGDGRVSGFMYIPAENFAMEAYSEVYLDVDSQAEVYSDQYSDDIEALRPAVEDKLAELADGRYDDIVVQARSELDAAKAEYESGLSEYEASRADAYEQLDETKAELDAAQAQLDSSETELNERLVQANASQDALASSIAQIEAQISASTDQSQIAALQEQLAQVQAGLAQTQQGISEIQAGLQTLQDRQTELDAAYEQYEDALSETDAELKAAEESLAEAQSRIEDAEKAIEDLPEPSVYCLGRDTNTGYVYFESDSDIVDGIAKVFPVFFFLVAALVCSTTMTRMVDEQRTQIGTFKALGYGDGVVACKYMAYSGSAALIGAVIGFIAGSALFPYAIWQAYNMLYGFAPILYVFDPALAVISLVVALICSAGVTYVACRGELNRMPAALMRPKSPKPGKRILLERFTFMWKRVPFLQKVSLRNIFRYRKRFVMMLLGIGGCTALILTGFGIRDSVSNIAEDQFDNIMLYDYSVSFADELSEQDMSDFVADSQGLIGECAFLRAVTADVYADGIYKSVNVIASSDENMSSMLSLHLGSDPVQYPDRGCAVINRKLSSITGAEVGDEIQLRLSDSQSVKVKVSGIFDNYVYNYVIMSAETYADLTGGCAYNTAYALASTEDVHAAAASLVSDCGAASVSVVQDVRDRVSDMMRSLDSIVGLIIFCAGALAFVVLFNLSNINITERSREIATVKVLGFYPSETGAYVFRENFVLTLFGTIVGLPLGFLLHRFVMNQINIDMVSFNMRILPLSYLFAVALTFVFTIIVDLLMRRKLNRIDMAGSLKSVE